MEGGSDKSPDSTPKSGLDKVAAKISKFLFKPHGKKTDLTRPDVAIPSPEVQPASQPIASEVRVESEIIISSLLQQRNFDCGQTVLDMLGYKGHEMFPNHEITSEQLRNLPGAREVTLPVGREEELDYNYPKVWIFVGKDKVAGANHWVIRHKDKIYCPTLGEMDVEEYKKKYVAFVLQEFELPAEGQQSPEQYYGQHGTSQPRKIREDIEEGSESGEYGTRQWAEWMAKNSGQNADWWYNSAGAKGHRSRVG